jgi:hypothetical protein
VPTTWPGRCWSPPGTARSPSRPRRRLWAYGAGLDRREFAICAGSVGLTMADALVRQGRTGHAAGAVPGMVKTLEQILALAAV